MSIPETKESQIKYNDGEVAVKKSSGLIKMRKGQSEEEYQNQLAQFQQEGALIQDENYTLSGLENDLTGFETKSKIEKEWIMHGLERLYYLQNYTTCIDKVNTIQKGIIIPDGGLEGKKNKVLKRIVTELNNLEQRCLDKIQKENEEKLENTQM